MQLTKEEIIKLLKSRIELSKNNKDTYELIFKESMHYMDVEKINKSYHWMLEEKCVLVELEYILNLITGKGVNNG